MTFSHHLIFTSWSYTSFTHHHPSALLSFSAVVCVLSTHYGCSRSLIIPEGDVFRQDVGILWKADRGEGNGVRREKLWRPTMTKHPPLGQNATDISSEDQAASQANQQQLAFIKENSIYHS